MCSCPIYRARTRHLTISRMLLDKGYHVADPLFAYYLLREF